MAGGENKLINNEKKRCYCFVSILFLASTISSFHYLKHGLIMAGVLYREVLYRKSHCIACTSFRIAVRMVQQCPSERVVLGQASEAQQAARSTEV